MAHIKSIVANIDPNAPSIQFLSQDMKKFFRVGKKLPKGFQISFVTTSSEEKMVNLAIIELKKRTARIKANCDKNLVEDRIFNHYNEAKYIVLYIYDRIPEHDEVLGDWTPKSTVQFIAQEDKKIYMIDLMEISQELIDKYLIEEKAKEILK